MACTISDEELIIVKTKKKTNFEKYTEASLKTILIIGSKYSKLQQSLCIVSYHRIRIAQNHPPKNAST